MLMRRSASLMNRIRISGLLFFAAMPFTKVSLDFLFRSNIQNPFLGRAWALIGLLSQPGFAAAYALSGVLADYVITPLLLVSGQPVQSMGRIIGSGSGRGTGLLIIAGILLCVTSVIVYNIRSIRKLENRGGSCFSEQSAMTC